MEPSLWILWIIDHGVMFITENKKESNDVGLVGHSVASSLIIGVPPTA